ncbi:MAG: hypothetical protein EXX96DRAFT_540645 [Benjaminiella poitrasii]|nr:MAG: hypothetical protein EXX96DRAFT_540645 [Benjaminiella poitrasii]
MTLESLKNKNLWICRLDVCMASLKGMKWSSNHGYGEAKLAIEKADIIVECRNLIRVAIFTSTLSILRIWMASWACKLLDEISRFIAWYCHPLVLISCMNWTLLNCLISYMICVVYVPITT